MAKPARAAPATVYERNRHLEFRLANAELFKWNRTNRWRVSHSTVKSTSTRGLWGLRDGSAGICKGYLIKSDNWNEIKLFAATFLAAATQGIKDYDEFITETGSTVQLAKSTARQRRARRNDRDTRRVCPANS